MLLYVNIFPNNDIFSSLKEGQGVNLKTHLWKPKQLKLALGFSGNRENAREMRFYFSKAPIFLKKNFLSNPKCA